MTFEELRTGLNNLFPTNYDHFTRQPTGIYVTYIDNGQDDFYSDDFVQVERYNIDIDLHTPTKDLAAERRLKDFFRDNEIPYIKDDTIFIIEDGVYITTFGIELIQTY